MKYFTKKRLACLTLALCTLGLAGCVVVTPAQQERIDALGEVIKKGKAEIDAIAASIVTLVDKGVEIKDTIAGLIEDARTGKIGMDDFARLMQIYETQRHEVGDQVAQLRTDSEAIAGTVVEAEKEFIKLREEGVSIWYIIGSVGLNLLGGAGGLKFLDKFRKLRTGFGVVSRALDTLSPDNAGKAVLAEIRNTPGASTDLMKPLHHAASDRNI